MLIKRGLNTVAEVGVPLQSSNYTKSLMGEEQITLVWEAPAFVALYLGDYVVYEGANFTLNSLPTVKKISSNRWQYNAVFQSTKYDMAKAMYMLFDNTGTPPQGEFSLTGTADTFIDLLIANLNRVAGSSLWSVGQVVENTDFKTLTFTNEDCLTVLARIASEFNTEYHVANRLVHLKRISTERQITLQYGSTLYDIERASTGGDIATRLYAFGSTKNLAADYRGGNSPLRIPVSAGEYIENNVAQYGVIEKSITFDDIYPRLSSGGAGVVTGVGNYLDFTDSALDFNVNDYRLDGTKAKVRFNTGKCAGYDFEIASYNHATKTFVLVPNTQENDFTLPTDDLKPAVGDKYVLLDIIMPPAYLAAAEAELLAKAQEYLSQNSTPKVAYKTTFSAIYAKQNLQSVECGDTVTVYDADMGINEQIRIVKLTKGLTESGGSQSLTIDLSNTVTATRLQRIEGNLAAVENNVIVTNQRVNRNNLRAYQNTKELREMVFDPDGYFDAQNIKPLSIETSMLSVGAKSQSFQLSSLLQPNYAGNPQVMQWSAGLLTHFTIADNAITEWTISQGSITITGGNQTSALYIYARCSRAGSTGDIYLSPVALKFNEGSTYYYFLIGVLHTPVESGGSQSLTIRGISLTYGQTTINGQFIKTGVISSIDGATYFNLNTGEIGGNIKFRSTSGALKTVEQAIDEVEVGGRNLMLNSEAQRDWSFAVQTSELLTVGQQYTLSFDVIGDVNGLVFLNPSISGNISKGHIDIWRRVSIVFTFIKDDYAGIEIYPHVYGATNVRRIKLEKGNKATDWSPSSEDVQSSINTAQNAANTANQSVSSLNTYVDGAFKDGVIDSAEAKAIEKYINTVNTEYDNAINSYNVVANNSYLDGTPKTTLINAKVTLAGAKDSLMSAINTAIADGKTTVSEKAAVDAAYASYKAAFGSYSTALENANKAIQQKLDSLSTDKVANLKPAGKNYLINSRTDNVAGWVLSGGTATVVTDAQYGKVVEYSRPAGGADFMKSFTIDTSELKNTELVYYCIAKPISGTTIFNFGGWTETFAMLNNSSPYRDLGNGWRMYYKVFTAGSAIASGVTFGLNSVGGTWRFHSFGVAKGNTPPSDWDASPKESDFLKEIFENANEETGGDINGGSWMTNLLRMRGTDGVVRGGLSGLAGDNIGMWAGGTYQQALDRLAKIILRKDGSGQLAGGNISWGVDGNLLVKGAIEALSGQFGLLKILGTSIIGDHLKITDEAIESKATATGMRNYTIPSKTELRYMYKNAPTQQMDSNVVTIESPTTISYVRGTYGYGEMYLYSDDPADDIVLSTDCTCIVRVTIQCLNNGNVIASANSAYSIVGVQNGSYKYPDNLWGASLSNIAVSAGTVMFRMIATISDFFPSAAWIDRPAIRLPMNMRITADSSSARAATNLTVSAYVKRTMLGGDGLYNFANANRYVYWRGAGDANDIFEVRLNNSILKMTETYFDIPGGLGGGTISSGGGISNRWGLAGTIASRSSNTTTIKHNVTDTKFTVDLTPRSSFTWYLSSITAASSPTANDGNIVIVCSSTTAVFDFTIKRTPY